jgi:uncharacterized protein (TIGR03382 family)
MIMKSVIASLVAVAGIAVAASADVNTRIDMLVSSDGSAFSPEITVAPGSHVQVLVSVTYTGTAAPIGLGSFVFQPTVSNYVAGSSADGYVNGGAGSNTSTPVGTISDSAGQYGRISPWARTALGTSQAISNFNNNSVGQPAGSWLRIAQRQVTAWFGGAGNTSGGSGVPIAQLSNVGRTTADPAFVGSLTDVHVFRFGFTVSAGALLDMVVDAPLEGFGNRDSTTGNREVYWFDNMNENTGSIRGTAVVVPGIVHVPTPASLALLGLGGLAMGRRRR